MNKEIFEMCCLENSISAEHFREHQHYYRARLLRFSFKVNEISCKADVTKDKMKRISFCLSKENRDDVAQYFFLSCLFMFFEEKDDKKRLNVNKFISETKFFNCETIMEIYCYAICTHETMKRTIFDTFEIVKKIIKKDGGFYKNSFTYLIKINKFVSENDGFRDDKVIYFREYIEKKLKKVV